MTSSPPADDRGYPDRPFVGVGAVVWRGDEFLLIRRGKAPRLGDWSLPGGAQEVGETVFEAAVREIREETAIEITVTGLIDVIDSIHRDDDGRVNFHFTLIDVSAEWRAGEAKPGSDALTTAWFRLGELAGLGLWTETERIIRLSAETRIAA